MKSFKDFNLKPNVKGFVGDKIRIERVMNREIVVHDYKVEPSKFDKGDGQRLTLQISIGETKHIIFTGSSVLKDLIQRVPKENFPFKTTIVKENEQFEFS